MLLGDVEVDGRAHVGTNVRDTDVESLSYCKLLEHIHFFRAAYKMLSFGELCAKAFYTKVVFAL